MEFKNNLTLPLPWKNTLRGSVVGIGKHTWCYRRVNVCVKRVSDNNMLTVTPILTNDDRIICTLCSLVQDLTCDYL